MYFHPRPVSTAHEQITTLRAGEVCKYKTVYRYITVRRNMTVHTYMKVFDETLIAVWYSWIVISDMPLYSLNRVYYLFRLFHLMILCLLRR